MNRRVHTSGDVLSATLVKCTVEEMEKQSRALVAGFAAAVGALLFFGWLAGAVLRGQTLEMDGAIRNAVHTWASPRLTQAMLGVTELGAPSVLVPLGLLVAWRLYVTGRRRAAAIFAVAAVGAESLDIVLKVVFRRARPEAFFGYAQPLGYSFPSGHSIVSCCFYGVTAAILTVRMRSLAARIATWTVAALLVAAIGFSRVYLGVHYPTDVLAGYVAGIIWVAAVRLAYEIRLRRGRTRAQRNE
jgi:undecaprenyl-diphosphatase